MYLVYNATLQASNLEFSVLIELTGPLSEEVANRASLEGMADTSLQSPWRKVVKKRVSVSL